MFSLRTVVSRRRTSGADLTPVGSGTEIRCQYGTGSSTTGATRTETQRTLKMKKTIMLNFSGDSALSAGYDRLILNFESGG